MAAAEVAAHRRDATVALGREPALEGVLFDYGETLVEFSRPDDALAAAEEAIVALLEASGPDGTILGDPSRDPSTGYMRCSSISRRGELERDQRRGGVASGLRGGWAASRSTTFSTRCFASSRRPGGMARTSTRTRSRCLIPCGTRDPCRALLQRAIPRPVAARPARLSRFGRPPRRGDLLRGGGLAQAFTTHLCGCAVCARHDRGTHCHGRRQRGRGHRRSARRRDARGAHSQERRGTSATLMK